MLKRWFSSAFIAGVCMLVDGLALIGVTRVFAPGKPPMWATAPFFWSVAWPVQLFTWILPANADGKPGSPPMLAVALAAILDLLLWTLLVDWFRRRRTR